MAKSFSDLRKAAAPHNLENTAKFAAPEGTWVQDPAAKAPKAKIALQHGKKGNHELTQTSTNALERDQTPTPLETANADGLATFGSASTTPPSDPDANLLGTWSLDTLHAAQGDFSLAAYSDFSSGNFGHSYLLAQAATEPTSPATSTQETSATPAASSPFVPAASWAWFIPAALAGVGAFKATSSTSDTVTRLRVVDGPVKDAKVYIDLDGDGVIDDGEPEVGFTDSTGFATVTLTAEQAKHALLAKGGTDTETNKAFAGVLAAPAGSTVINPLTTLVAALMEGGQSLAEAKAGVVTALGLTGVSDLTSYDTFAQASTPEGMANHRKAVQIANIIVAGSALAASDNTAAEQTGAASLVIDALAAKIAGTSGAVTFDAAVLTAVLRAAGATSHAASVAAAIESVNTLVAKASGPDALKQVAQAQVLAQVTLTNAIQTAATGGLDTVTALQDSTTAAQMASQIDLSIPDEIAPPPDPAPTPPPGNEEDTLAPVMLTGASWATSFNEGALSSKLNMDVPDTIRNAVSGYASSTAFATVDATNGFAITVAGTTYNTNGNKTVNGVVTANEVTVLGASPTVTDLKNWINGLGDYVSASVVDTTNSSNWALMIQGTQTGTTNAVSFTGLTGLTGATPTLTNTSVTAASVVLDTANQQLDFSAQGIHFLYEYDYRDDAPIVWADLPEVQLGQSWSVQTLVSINDGLTVPQQSAGIVFYDADGGVPNFNFSLTKWIQATSTLSSVAGVATQSGGGNGISGEAYSLLAPETSDVYLKVQVTELGQTDHYQFFYKGLLAQDPWIAVGDARTYTSKGNDSRVGLFYKTNQVTAGATFDDFAITVPVSVAENSTGTVYTANAIAEGENTLTYALSGNDSALFSINTNTGALAFKAAPNFEAPLDNDGDNQYDLTVTASDGVASSVPQSVVIAVTNMAELSAVNVTVAPAQVAEGDAGKLVFTFSRSSDLDGELSVDIDVTGTAGNVDYSRPVQMQSQWTRLLGASRNSQGQPSAAVGADGAVYVSGRADSALMDGTKPLSESGGGYVRKFDADGSLVWTRLTDAVNDNYPYSVTTGSDGGVYVAGMAYNPAQSNYDGFVNKFDADGTLAWTRFVGTLEYDSIQTVSTDASGTVYVAGLTYSSQTGTYSTFLSKLESDGVVAWTRPLASGYSQAVSVSAAADGSVYVTGYSNSAILDGTTLLSNAGSFISKYDAVGHLEWTRLPDAPGSGQTNSVSAGADGAVYVAGYAYNAVSQNNDGFVTKFDAAGTLVWTRFVGGSGHDDIKSVFTGEDGAVYLAGETNSSSLNGQVIMGAPNTTNGFVAKLDVTDGTLAWTHLIGGSSNDLIKSVSVDADGVVYVAGETYSSSLNGQSNLGNVAGFVSKILPASLTQVTFAPGSATATLALKATSDTLIEGNETVTVTVKPGQSYTVGSSGSATGTIEDKLESDGNSVNINSRTNGNISVDGETDLYSIQLTKGEKYVFTLEANSPGLDAGLNLFTTRSASSESLLLTNDNAFYLNNNARITYTAQETGTYYLQANGGVETSGDYLLSVSDSDVPTPKVEFMIPSAVYLSETTGNWTTEISWRSQEFYLYLDTPWSNTKSDILPTWANSEAPVKPTLIEVNGFGSFAELSSNINDNYGRPLIQSNILQEILPDTNYVYTIASGTIKDSNGLTNDYYESTIFHTSADIIGPVAMKGGVATGTHAGGTYAYLTGFSSLDVATPGQTLSIATSPEYLFVQFNEPVRWPAGGWNQEWSAAAQNNVIDGVYLVENDVRVYEFGVAYIPARSDYEVGNIHLDLENKTGSDTPNNDEAIWLDLRNGFKQGDIPVGYTLKEGAKYTLVFDVGMYDPMLNFSEPMTPPFEFSFSIEPIQQPLVSNVTLHVL